MIEVRTNGQVIELKEGEKISYTKQVNDIGDVSTVNSSYTNSFKAPLTPNNIQVMEMLGLVGDTSRKPYTKVPTNLYDSSVLLLKDGWLNIKQTTDEYDLSIQDGIIDFFKTIENKKIGVDVDLSELNHVKNVQTVIDSFDNEYYRYLINDYGGKTFIEIGASNFINVDYLVPSARVEYIWNRIFETFGFTYGGQIFNNENFKNAWITFPKTNSELIEEDIATFEIDSLPAVPGGFQQDENGRYELTVVTAIHYTNIEEEEAGYFEVVPEFGRIQPIEILQDGNYQLDINFSATAAYMIRRGGSPLSLPYAGAIKLEVYKNDDLRGAVISDGEEATIAIPVNAGDVLSFKVFGLSMQELQVWAIENEEIIPPNGTITDMGDVSWGSFTYTLEKVTYDTTDFNNVFKDWSVKDFIKEVLWRFALTPIPNGNHIEFYSINQLLNKRRAHDWSDKYVRRKSEKYQIGNYAQINWFKHKYNEEEKDYNDGKILINNQNLDDETTLLTSKFYAPDENYVFKSFLTGTIQQYRPTQIWNKEIEQDEDTEEIKVSYKGQTGRYYWLKSVQKSESLGLTSEQLGETEISSGYKLASTYFTTFDDLVPYYHSENIQLLNDIRIHELELNLTQIDILNLDFTNPYYFKQEASFYKLNKVVYKENERATAEFIKLT